MVFRDDERGQSVLIGSILLFGILVIAFAGYQAFAVPNQNAGTEFQHEQQVQSQFLEIRNGIMRSATEGTSSFTDLELGTDYTVRLVALNPPPVSGTIQTTSSEQISVEDGGTDITGNVCRGPDETRRLQYEASYNELGGTPTYRMENTVAYRQFDNAVRIQSSQRLLSDRSVNLVPIQGSFSESGSGTESIEPVPGRVKAQTVTDPVIELPTALDQATWNELLADELDSGESATVSGETLTLDLSGEYNLVCSPVGINQAPPGGVRNSGELSGGGSGGSQINPSGAQGVFLTDISRQQNPTDNTNIEFTFENRGDEARTFEQARFALYYASNSKAQQSVDVRGETLQLRGEYVSLGNPIEIPAGGSETVTLDFQDGADGDLIGISFIDDRNEELLYLGGSDDSTNNGGNGGGGGNPSTQQLQPVNGSVETSSGDQLLFDIKNTESTSVIVTNFSIDLSGVGENNAKLDNDNSDEVSITGSTINGRANRGGSFDTKSGTTYSLDDNAEIAGGDEVTVDFRQIRKPNGNPDNIGNLQFTNDEANADVTVTLGLQDGTEQVFYFEQTN
jgi:hypothetical protein